MTSVNSFRHQYARTRVALVALVFTVIVAALAFSSRDVSSQSGDPQRRDLEKVFSRHDRLSLDPGQIARQVKQSRSLTLTTSRGTFEMTLEPHDIRAPGYVAEAWGDNGSVRVLERGPVRTYKGTVQGLSGAQARFTIDEETVEGLIITPKELLFLEPTKRYSGAAAKTDFVFYSGSDLKESAGECGNTMAEIVAQHSANVSSQTSSKGPQPESVFGPQQQIAVALEADFEYYQAFASSVPNVETQILTIMNAVDGIYGTDTDPTHIGLRFSFSATNLRVWTSDTDPYTEASPSLLLGEFRNSYNTSPPPQGAGRDIAHLFTGRDLTGSTIGIAYQPGLDCPLGSLGYGYGISQHLTGPSPNFPGLTAHEIGHNLSASHVTGAQGVDCTSSIMNPSISASQSFCQFSKDEITTHTIQMSDCLTPLGAECASVPPSSPNIPANGGSVSVNVTASPTCNWAVAEGAAWLTVTSGASGTGNGTVMFSAMGNSCGQRTALVNVGGQILSVTQAGNPTYLTDPATATAIAPGQTLNGDLSTSDCPTGLAGRQNAHMDRYKFNGMAGENIRIEMNAAIPPPTGLDTYLYLIFLDGTLNGTIVNENDDIQLGSLTNSRIPCANVPGSPCAVEFFTLPQTGTYIIVATSFDNNETGAYSLTLTSVPLLLTAQVTDNVGSSAAVNSVTFARTSNANNTAFRVFDPFNFSSDQTTRLILFTSDLGLAQTQNPSSTDVSVSAGGQQLLVEHVGPLAFPGSTGFPAVNGSYIIVALKTAGGPLTGVPGNFVLTVTSRGQTSNQTTITIAP